MKYIILLFLAAVAVTAGMIFFSDPKPPKRMVRQSWSLQDFVQ